MFEAKNHVTRLSKYKSVIRRLKAIGVNRIFSDNLADAAGVTSAQVRKDFSIFGITGNKKAGYQADHLISEIERLLGKEEGHRVVLAGYGNIGKALVSHKGFEKENIRIVAAFDRDVNKYATEGEVPVLPIGGIGDYISENRITLAILALSDHAAQDVADTMIHAGIRGILNFSSLRIQTPACVFVNNIDIEMALETIIFYTHSPVKEKG